MNLITDIAAWLVIGAACIVIGAIIVPLFVRTVLFLVALVEWIVFVLRNGLK